MKYKGEIKDFPQHVVEAMLDEQEKQGNKRDVKVFEGYSLASRSEGGFAWKDTLQGNDFWCSVIVNKNFDLIPQPQKYPKIMLVSSDKKTWFNRVVFMKKNNEFLAWCGAETLKDAEKICHTTHWPFAKDIKEEKIPEYTMEELFDKLGTKFIIKK